MAISDTFSFANNQGLAAGASTASKIIRDSAIYGWNYQFGGTSPSLRLEYLGLDNTTWLPVSAAVTASGSQLLTIVAGSGGVQLRVTNTGSNPITNLYTTINS